ncbi:hypothetical protein INT43_003853 [Umbelopsis isabellina]|uniref:Phosphatidylinositol N-acetylglucosaminyltransferase subunit H conserved domain-containing protein n=1 Tax=Mortierella isabellina TaxID=91625 RepID=A0A8H7UC19_MORIS|nr:hypothetical protein INT43_003853 [Umbelopsis isabellina]
MKQSQNTLTPLTEELSYRSLPGVREYVVHSNERIWTVTTIAIVSALGILSYTTKSIPWAKWVIGSIFVLLTWIKLNTVKEERILAIRNVGVQVKTIYLSGRSISHFVERSRICDIIIHEAITIWQVKFYMAIIVVKQDRMKVVFEHLLPPLNPTLITAYRGVRSMMFSDSDPESD